MMPERTVRRQDLTPALFSRFLFSRSLPRRIWLHRFGPPTLIMLGSLWLLQGVFARTGSHGVIIRNSNYDAGQVKVGSKITNTVWLINLSLTPVAVSAQPGCGCTVVNVPNTPLAPLHREVIKLEVDTDGMAKGQQQMGVLLRMQTGRQSWNRLAAINFHLL